MTQKNNSQALAPVQQNNGAAEKTAAAPSPSERFTQLVLREYAANAGGLELSTFQRRLIQNYFIKMDQSLKEQEVKRLSVPENKRDLLAFTWNNVNMDRLATDVVAYACVGLDPLQKNHVNLIAFKNSKTSKFDVGFVIGYQGCELKAKKYGLDVPDDFVIELVYTTDKFKSIKKSVQNRVESYEFEITDEFNRGEVIGGFYYHIYFDKPEKNKLEIFSLKDILKRKPDHASPEFWGGEKDVWKDGQKVGTKPVEGWFDEMAWKTIARACYNEITIDSEKIDKHYLKMIEVDNERRSAQVDTRVAEEINSNANKKTMDFDEEAKIVDENPVASIATPEPSADPAEKKEGDNNLFSNGPGY